MTGPAHPAPASAGRPEDDLDAALQDLLDGRLDPTAEAALRARIRDEPAVSEAWEDLVRVGAMLRARPVPSLPADFLERLRARREHEAEASGAERVAAPWRRRLGLAYTAAATLILALGAWAYYRGGPAAVETASVEPEEAWHEDDARKDRGLAEDRAALLGGARSAGAAGRPEPPSAPRGPFPAPGGAVPPGLREPSDEPLRRGARPLRGPDPSAAPGAGRAPATPAEAAEEGSRPDLELFLVAADLDAGRAELQALLASLAVPRSDLALEPSASAPGPRGPELYPAAALGSERARREASDDEAGPHAATPEPPSIRLRLEPAAARRLEAWAWERWRERTASRAVPGAPPATTPEGAEGARPRRADRAAPAPAAPPPEADPSPTPTAPRPETVEVRVRVVPALPTR